MPALLALLSSLAWGVADVAGGVATRRVGSPRTLALSYPAGALAITVFALTIVPGVIDSTVLWLSVYTAVAGTLAMVLLYGALAIGPMGVVSPLTAVGGAAVPVVVGIARGESVTVLIVIGMVLAAIAVILVSRESGPHARVTLKGLVLSGGAGLFIGLYLVGLGIAPDDSGIWVASLSRWWSSIAMITVALVLVLRRPAKTGARYPWLLAVSAGILDASANALFNLAAQGGELLVVAVIGSLYPAATIVLAHFVLHERMSRIQWSGVVLALAAAVALTV
jgi:drug/metabolite transporter (DMT)-like permease